MREKARTGEMAAIALAALCAIGLAFLQPKAADRLKKVKQRDDVVALPPPAQMRALTLGYKHAAADLLWAKLVVEYGIHGQEKRAFPEATRYVDAILAVEPDFKLLYEFLDTILVYTPTGGTRDDAITARKYLEYGTTQRPYDPEMWLKCGQFIAFLGPSFLKDEAEIERWRHDGALAIMRAVELGADPDRSIAAATLLKKSGEKRVIVAALQRAYAMADDEETRRQIRFKLEQQQASLDAEQAGAIVDFEQRAYYPYFSKGHVLLIGPRRSPVACAGPMSHERKQCPRDWSQAIENR